MQELVHGRTIGKQFVSEIGDGEHIVVFRRMDLSKKKKNRWIDSLLSE
jgi:hypothetical protein